MSNSRYDDIFDNTRAEYQDLLEEARPEPNVQAADEYKKWYYKKLLLDLEYWGRHRYHGDNYNKFQDVMERHYVTTPEHEGTYRFGNALPPPRRGGLRRTRRHRKHRKHNRHTRRHRKHSRR